MARPKGSKNKPSSAISEMQDEISILSSRLDLLQSHFNRNKETLMDEFDKDFRQFCQKFDDDFGDNILKMLFQITQQMTELNERMDKLDETRNKSQ